MTPDPEPITGRARLIIAAADLIRIDFTVGHDGRAAARAFARGQVDLVEQGHGADLAEALEALAFRLGV